MKAKIYVGLNAKQPRAIFTYDKMPTELTHGATYDAVIGPFKTWRGARFMALYGQSNPHCQTVEDAEKLGKLYGDNFLKS